MSPVTFGTLERDLVSVPLSRGRMVEVGDRVLDCASAIGGQV
jgi:hypothetical protein